jgi:hypothetical protein
MDGLHPPNVNPIVSNWSSGSAWPVLSCVIVIWND